MKNISFQILLFIFLLSLLGCPPRKVVIKEELPPPTRVEKISTPSIVIKFATINMSIYNKKIDSNEILKFSRQLKQDSIDILTMQGITRYPEIKTRLDIIEELSKLTGMQNSFGESINILGKQNGHAVFSTYPIRSSENLQFENLKSTGFESAIQAFVDCGVKEVGIVSTQISKKATAGDIEDIHTSLKKLFHDYSTKPIIISGNMNTAEDTLYNIISDEKHYSPTVWFTKNNSLKLISQETVQTIFGKMKIINFGIYIENQR